MKRVVITLAALMLMLGVGTYASGLDLQGSDTLKHMTDHLLTTYPTDCGGDPNEIVYVGGGSSAGWSAMRDGLQSIAPMSSRISGSKCTGYEATAAHYAHSLDALSVYRTQNNFADADDQICTDETEVRCEGVANETAGIVLKVRDVNGTSGINCPGCVDDDGDGVTDDYVITDWKDVLGLAYFGLHHGGTTRDCNSDARYALAGLPALTPTGGYEPLPLDCSEDCWENFFMQDPSVGCTDEKCNVNWHIWRRGNASGTSETFAGFFGLKVGNFCNGPSEEDDNDPIRRPVHPQENIPGKLGMTFRYSTSAADCTGINMQTTDAVRTLGWLLPVVVPPVYSGKNDDPCVQGVFSWRECSLRTNNICDTGENAIFGLCLVPLDAANEAGCVNNEANGGMFWDTVSDTRSANLIERNADGVVVLDETGNEVITAYYNIHALTPISTYVPNCNHDNSTDQIACLTAASPCSVGYAGMGADAQVPQTWQLEVNGIQSNKTNIRAGTYPMWRYLYLATLAGFSTVTGVEHELAECFRDRNYADTAAIAAGFITLDDNGAGQFVPEGDPCP